MFGVNSSFSRSQTRPRLLVTGLKSLLYSSLTSFISSMSHNHLGVYNLSTTRLSFPRLTLRSTMHLAISAGVWARSTFRLSTYVESRTVALLMSRSRTGIPSFTRAIRRRMLAEEKPKSILSLANKTTPVLAAGSMSHTVMYMYLVLGQVCMDR